MGCRSLYLKRPILPQNEMTALPNPDLIYDLFGGIFKPQFIRIALQLDVFTPLAENPSTAEQIAQACGCDTTGMKANSGGTAHSFETYREWLNETGFPSVSQLSERWLAARK